MDFVQAQESNRPLMPQGWQHNTYDTTGDTFYVHLVSGCIVFKLVTYAIRRIAKKEACDSGASPVGNDQGTASQQCCLGSRLSVFDSSPLLQGQNLIKASPA
jgi:hypothetical protein